VTTLCWNISMSAGDENFFMTYAMVRAASPAGSRRTFPA
jgi:hypothetical protein